MLFYWKECFSGKKLINKLYKFNMTNLKKNQKTKVWHKWRPNDSKNFELNFFLLQDQWHSQVEKL